jgi:hypothetical protein
MIGLNLRIAAILLSLPMESSRSPRVGVSFHRCSYLHSWCRMLSDRKKGLASRNLPLAVRPLNRRQLLVAGLVAAATAIPSRTIWAESKDQKKLDQASNGKGLFRVRTVVQLNGDIRLKSQTADSAVKNGKTMTAKTAPIQATSTVDFDEQFESDTDIQACRTYQHFHEATSEIQIDKHVTKTTLREQCKDIVRFGSDQGLVTACPDNPLFAAERDLVEGPINSMFLDQLLTDREVNIADKWTIDSEVACRLLNVDAIQEGKLVMCLVDADDDKAQLEMDGYVSASVRQVPTTIKVEGKAQLDRATGTISWFAANLEETRDISESEPGFHVNAQVKILRSPISVMTSGLTLDKVSGKVTNMESATLLQFQSDLGYFRFLANRKWSTYRDNGEEATLRFVTNNRVLCQCNMTNMIDLEPGRQLSLDGFKADVRRTLGDNQVEMLEGSERLTSSKLRMLRVMSRGSVQGINILWLHYHLSNDSGRRIVLTFTMNEANAEHLADEDSQIVDTLELVNWPTKLDAKAIESAQAEEPADKKQAVASPQTLKKAEQAKTNRSKLAR